MMAVARYQLARSVRPITLLPPWRPYGRAMKHHIQFFYSDHCFGCPAARKIVREFAATRPDIAVTEFDVEIHAALARRCGVIATPAVIVDGGRVRYGVPTPMDLQIEVLPR